MLIQRVARKLFPPNEEEAKFYKVSTEIEYDSGRLHEEHTYKYFKDEREASLYAEGFGFGVASALGGNEVNTTYSVIGRRENYVK